jgi:hypothetical protein
MREWFVFRFAGTYYRCVTLPFGWVRSPLCISQLMISMVRWMRISCGYRVLTYLDDFLIAPTALGVVSTAEDCKVSTKRIDQLLAELGLRRHQEKEGWAGTTQIEHLKMTLDSVEMRFFIAEGKVGRARKVAAKLLEEAARGRRWVSKERLRSFVGLCVSLTMALPYARIYKRSLYWDLSRSAK